MVPVRLPFVVGVKMTVKVQVVLFCRFAVKQLFVPMVYSPSTFTAIAPDAVSEALVTTQVSVEVCPTTVPAVKLAVEQVVIVKDAVARPRPRSVPVVLDVTRSTLLTVIVAEALAA
jgi:hypothetical protein